MDRPDARKTPSSEAREARLAQALRANLRRRKAPARAADPDDARSGDQVSNAKDTD